MGYDVHITRKENWFEETGPEISLDEWVAYVSGDPEMRLDNFAEAANGNGAVLRIEKPGISVWLTYSGHDIDGNMAWFGHTRGRIVVKNPDEEILGKMWSIAQSLSARVQGDEGEIYNEEGEASVSEEPPSAVRKVAKKPWWKLW